MDVNKLWTAEVCQEVAEEIFANFDQNGDGSLDFEVGMFCISTRVMEWNGVSFSVWGLWLFFFFSDSFV